MRKKLKKSGIEDQLHKKVTASLAESVQHRGVKTLNVCAGT
jgi:hypothetical protein